MNDHGDEFRDDELAAGIRRCWGAERCPAELLGRLSAVTAAASAPRAYRGRRMLRWPLVAAAAVAVTVGVGRLLRVSTPVSCVSVVPMALETELVHTHDHCGRAADHQRLPVPRANPYAIAASLRSQLDRPVLVSRPIDDGWRFSGASVCPVGQLRSAHLMFRRADGDTLSIFSLPRSAAPNAVDGQQFQGQVGDHVIVGFVRRRAVYCLVASGCAGDVSTAKMTALRARLERQIVVADGPKPLVPPGGELIHWAGD